MDRNAQVNLGGWHRATPSLVAAIGSAAFAGALDQALRTIAPFDLSCAFAYPGREKPLLLHDGLGGVSSSQIMQNYLEGTYLLDAVYTACSRLTPDGLYRLTALAPDAFFEGEYYNSPHVHPCISMESGALAEEIVFLARIGGGTLYLAYSLLRQNGSTAFSDIDFAALSQAAPMVLALIARHWQNAAPPQRPPRPEPRGAENGIEHAFASFAPSRLTTREQTIVSLVLRGHSSVSIGQILGIAEGTVKIHRKNIYSKLEISGQTELFNLFVRHILKGDFAAS